MLLEIVTVPWRSSKGWIVFHTYIYINIISIKMEIKFIKRHKNATKTLWFWVCSCFENPSPQTPKEQSFLQHFSDKVLHVFILYSCVRFCLLVFVVIVFFFIHALPWCEAVIHAEIFHIVQHMKSSHPTKCWAMMAA